MTTEVKKKTAAGEVAVKDQRHARYLADADIHETPTELIAVLDMPGVDRDRIDVEYEDGTLTVRGHVESRHEKDTPFIWREYRVGDFYRSFRIAEDLDVDKISAKLTDGVLTLTLPKAQATKPRKIVVKPE